MKRKTIWLAVSCLTVLALLLASCAPAAEEEAAPTPTAPEEKAPAAEEEAAPAVEEEEAPEGADMVKITLTKVDGTTIEKMIERPRYGGTLTVGYSGDPRGWDEALPSVPPYSSSIYWIGHTNEELLEGRWDRGPAGTNEIGWKSTGYWANPDFYHGALAESWEFPDPETIIFHIRKGVYWHNKPPVNGREFTADDVVYTLKRIYFEETSSTMWGMALASRPTDIYAEDKYTVVVKNPPGQQGYTWEYLGDWTSMYAHEVIEKYGDANDWENVVGTGPFILTDYVRSSSATWERNPNYWGKDPLLPENQLPYVDRMRYIIIPDQSTMMSAIRTGQVDMSLTSFEEEHGETIINSSPPELKYDNYLYPVFYLLGFRLDKPELPFQDIRVRRALHMAINWKEIVDTYYGGRGEYLMYKVMPLDWAPDLMAAYTPVGELPLSADGFDNNKLYTYHPEEAKQMLAEAGYPNGFKTEAIVSSTSTWAIDMLTMFAAYWQQNLNVELFIDVKERGVYYNMHSEKSFKEGEICGRWGDQPYAACTVRKGSMYNWAMIDDPIADDYYNRMTEVYFDVPKRTEILKEFNLYLIDKVYYFVPPTGYRYTFWWPWLKGYHGERAIGVDNGIIQKFVWLDQELKKTMGY